MAIEVLQIPLSSLIPSITSHLHNISSIALPIMHSFTSLIIGSLAAQAVFAFPDPTRTKREALIAKRDLDSWIATETPYALNEILCAIGSGGCNAGGVSSGLVIASPDKTNPDCPFPP